MAITYEIRFSGRTHAAIALWEIHAWEVPDSQYKVDTKRNRIYFASVEVVDIITESIPAQFYTIDVEQKPKRKK